MLLWYKGVSEYDLMFHINHILGYAIVQLPELACSIYKYAQGRFFAYGISRQEVNSGENGKSKQRRKTVWYAKTPGEFDNSVVNEFKRWTEEDFDIFIKVALNLSKNNRRANGNHKLIIACNRF